VCCSKVSGEVDQPKETVQSENISVTESSMDSRNFIGTNDIKQTEEERRPVRINSGLNPRGLIDGLTRFFTPSDRRGPRACRDTGSSSSHLSSRHLHHRRHRMSESGIVPVSDTHEKANFVESKVDIVSTFENPHYPAVTVSSFSASTCASTSTSTSPRRRRRNDTSGTRRCREQLVDGLSHFFMAVGKRRSCIPLRLRNIELKKNDELEYGDCEGLETSASELGFVFSDTAKDLSDDRVSSNKLCRLLTNVDRSVAQVKSASNADDRVPPLHAAGK